MVGLAIDIPNSSAGDETQFGWMLNDDALTYTGASYYWDNTAQEATQDNTWLCSSVDSGDGSTEQGYCYNFMPTVSGQGTDYRFSTKDLVDVWGWSNIGGSKSIFSLSNNTVLMGAFSAGASLVAIVAASLTIAF